MLIRITAGTIQDGIRTVRTGETMEATPELLTSLRGSRICKYEPADPGELLASEPTEQKPDTVAEVAGDLSSVASSTPPPGKPKKAKGKK